MALLHGAVELDNALAVAAALERLEVETVSGVKVLLAAIHGHVLVRRIRGCAVGGKGTGTDGTLLVRHIDFGRHVLSEPCVFLFRASRETKGNERAQTNGPGLSQSTRDKAAMPKRKDEGVASG